MVIMNDLLILIVKIIIIINQLMIMNINLNFDLLIILKISNRKIKSVILDIFKTTETGK